MIDFPLDHQEHVLAMIRAVMPEGAQAVVVFVIPAPEHGQGAAVLSTLSTLPAEPSFAALTHIVLRHLRGETPEPIELLSPGRLQ